MKVLLLSVALLFFTGAQGRYIWQQDKPHQEQTSDTSIQSILKDGIAIVTNVLKNLDYEGLEKEYNLKEKVKAAKKHTEKLEEALEKYADEVWKEFDAKLLEKFPTFRTIVVPILENFDNALEEQFKKVVKEVVPVGCDLVSGISKHVTEFIRKLEDLAEKGRDTLRAEIDSLRVKLQPYVDEVHAEYKKYRSDMEGELQKDYKDLKEKVQKNYENLKEHAKPHLENLKDNFRDYEGLQARIEELLKQFRDYIKAIE